MLVMNYDRVQFYNRYDSEECGERNATRAGRILTIYYRVVCVSITRNAYILSVYFIDAVMAETGNAGGSVASQLLSQEENDLVVTILGNRKQVSREYVFAYVSWRRHHRIPPPPPPRDPLRAKLRQ